MLRDKLSPPQAIEEQSMLRKHFEDGGTIDRYSPSEGMWKPCKAPMFNFDYNMYRKGKS